MKQLEQRRTRYKQNNGYLRREITLHSSNFSGMHGASAEYWGLPQTSFKSITHVRWGSVSLQDSAYTVGNLSICKTCEVLSATFVLQNGNSTVSTKKIYVAVDGPEEKTL